MPLSLFLSATLLTVLTGFGPVPVPDGRTAPPVPDGAPAQHGAPAQPVSDGSASPADVSRPAATGWHWPLAPRPQVLRGFAPGPQPWSPGHRGVDLAATAGQPVLAPSSGVVTYAGAVAGRGVVVIAHGALRTTYEPVTAAVRRGRPVRTGQRIGTVQFSAASHCAPASCLHWGAILATRYVDPLLLVGAAGPVVLLPLGGSGDLGQLAAQLHHGLGVHLADP